MILQPPLNATVNDLWIVGLILAFIAICEALIIIYLFISVVTNKRENCTREKKRKTKYLIDD